MFVFKFIIGLLLLPICWVSTETLFLLFKNEARAGAFYNSPEFFFFSMGSAVCALLFLIARKNKVCLWLYVAGHELTHALFALICRSEVSKVHINWDGGHVRTNRVNFLISLSPYFFPFYTILLILIWALLEWALVDFSQTDFFWLYGLIGVTWTFHAAYTIWMLKRQQTDIEINGRLFSYTVIFVINMMVISCLLILASPKTTFKDFGLAWAYNFNSFGSRLWESLTEIVSFVKIFGSKEP